MPKYLVCLRVTCFPMYLQEADDEDAAVEKAMEEAEWDHDSMDFADCISVGEVKEGE